MIEVTGSVWPHDHTYREGGPLDVRLGVRVQHPLVTNWNKKTKPLFDIVQTEKDSNFTIIRLLFLKPGTAMPFKLKHITWHKATMFRIIKTGQVEIRIKTRFTNSLKHPVPVGQWMGTRQDEPTDVVDRKCNWVLYTIQHKTLDSIPEPLEPKTIITPGDEDFALPPSDIKRPV